MSGIIDDLVNHFAAPALAADGAGRLVVANMEAQGLFPLLHEGRPLAGAIRNSAFLSALDDVLGGKPAARAAFTLKKPRRHLLALLSDLKDEESRHIFIHFRDRSEEENLARMRMNFISSASHELRTPLASILGFIETLRGPAKNDEAARAEFLAIMEAQALRMKRLVDDMLNLSRIEANRHLPPEGRADLADIIRRVAALLRPRAKDLGVDLQVCIEADDAVIQGDANEIEQIVLNLTENALTYGREGGRARISLRRVRDDQESPRLALSVRDWGPGIEKKHIPRLTERFYRVDKLVSRNAGGTGLGLAIVKHLAGRHGAWLDIESQPGKGARFTVSFPAPA